MATAHGTLSVTFDSFQDNMQDEHCLDEARGMYRLWWTLSVTWPTLWKPRIIATGHTDVQLAKNGEQTIVCFQAAANADVLAKSRLTSSSRWRSDGIFRPSMWFAYKCASLTARRLHQHHE
jgi:hypothetical protein